MKKIIFAVFIVGICFYIFPKIAYAINDNCEVEIQPVAVLASNTTTPITIGSDIDNPINIGENLLGENTNKIKYNLEDIYVFRIFAPLIGSKGCDLKFDESGQTVLKYKSTSRNAINYKNREDFFGRVWISGSRDNLRNCTEDDINTYRANDLYVEGSIKGGSIVDGNIVRTDITTGKILFEFNTSGLVNSLFHTTNYTGSGSNAKDGIYFYFLLRLCTPGKGELYVVHDNTKTDRSSASKLPDTVKRISDKYKVNRGIIERNIDDVPGGPIVAQTLVSIFSGIMCWLVSQPITRTESAEVRGAIIQPIFGCAGMIFGALLLPVFGHGDWFLAAFLIILALAFASLIGVLTTRSP